ncbi:MAG: hypothetical protein ABIK36_21185 [Pseudomonadota bacterium]
MTRRDDDSELEARRILDRVEKESSADASLIGRGTNRLRGHLSADDVDQTDKIEVWGTRVGRGIGFLITLAIIGWLLLYLLGG